MSVTTTILGNIRIPSTTKGGSKVCIEKGTVRRYINPYSDAVEMGNICREAETLKCYIDETLIKLVQKTEDKLDEPHFLNTKSTEKDLRRGESRTMETLVTGVNLTSQLFI
jgi:hypothetical protein